MHEHEQIEELEDCWQYEQQERLNMEPEDRVKLVTTDNEVWWLQLHKAFKPYWHLRLWKNASHGITTALTWKQVEAFRASANNEASNSPIAFAGRGTHKNQLVYWLSSGLVNTTGSENSSRYLSLTVESQARLARYLNEFVLSESLG